MLYRGIELTPSAEKASLSHSESMDIIRNQSSTKNADWLDALGSLPWGKLKDLYFNYFAHASEIFSLVNMNYQVCNGGIAQYFDNGYHEQRDPFSENDVERCGIDDQKRFFSEVLDFAQTVYPERQSENDALSRACKAFAGLEFEEDAVCFETVVCDEDEEIWDDELEDYVPNPDYFEPYEESYNEDVIHGADGFDDLYYKANDYLEELLELEAQFCCKGLIREVERDHNAEKGLLESLKALAPTVTEEKLSLEDQIKMADRCKSADISALRESLNIEER